MFQSLTQFFVTQKVLFPLLIFWFFVLPVVAQEINLTFEHYEVEDGLSHRQVNSLCQDRQGFIWAGTAYGLNRFDGYEFKWWTKEKNGLFSNFINGVVEDASGSLWLIYHYSNPNRRFYHINHIDILDPVTGLITPFTEHFGAKLPLNLADIYAVYNIQGLDQSIYLGTSDTARLVRYHPESGFKISYLEGYKSFLPLALTDEGDVWGMLNDSLLVKTDTLGSISLKLAYEEELHFRHIAYDGQFLWIQLDGESSPASFQKVESKTGEIIPLTQKDMHLPEHLSFRGYQKIYYDSAHDYIWGINIHPYAAAFSAKPSQSAENIVAPISEFIAQAKIGNRGYLVDRSGQVWFGGDFGLSRITINPQRFKKYLYLPNADRPRDQIATRRMIRVKDQLIVTTDIKGIYQIDLNNKQEGKIDIPKSLIFGGDLKAFSVIKGTGPEIWTADVNIININLESEEIQVFKNDHNFLGGSVWSLFQDNTGRIWMGTENGLTYLDSSGSTVLPFIKYNNFETLAKSRVIDFVEDKDGGIWLCTNHGLYTLDLQEGVTARYWVDGVGKYQLPHDDIRHIYQDEEGIFWLATGGAGLIKWDQAQGNFQQFTRADGLANNFLYAIYEDQQQNLWMSSDFGIIQFDKNTFRVQTYQEQDGISHNEFNRTSHHQDFEGQIYFGGLNGVTAFNPEDFYSAETGQNAPLVITDFQQFDGELNQLVDKRKELLSNNKIVLKPNDRFFYLSFALLSYDKPEQIAYAYQVEGWDDDWQYQRERTLRLGRLPYGKHFLKIKAQAASGQWSKNELHIPVKVLRPFYLQWWFMATIVAIVVLLIIAIYRFTLRRQLEKQEAQQLKELDTLKTNFYTNITHEFRTPLTVIMGMMDNIKGFDQERKLVRRNSKGLLRLINQMLDLSKLESGSMTLNTVQGDIIGYLRYLTESFHSLADEKKIDLVFSPETPSLIMDYDETKIQQIIYNLLSNAIKFTPENGEVRLSVKVSNTLKVFKTLRVLGVLIIKIKDTGIGIPPTQLPHVFDRFYQVDGSSTRKGEGTGIGLALTRELIAVMAGEIEVKSTLGEGTTFTIQLPIKREVNTPNKSDFKQSKQVQLPENETALGKEMVVTPALLNVDGKEEERPLLLIIEDNPDVITYLVSLLKADYQIETAMDGQAGINKALEIVPDIIISDVMMPVKDGYEVCTTLKKDERTSHIPIVILTAKASDAARIIGLKTGADAYLMKPFNKEELFVRLEKLVELRQALQQRYANVAGMDASIVVATTKAKKEPTLDDLFLQKIRQVIDEKIGESTLGIADLCKAVHLSHTQVFRKLKALTGESPTGFIRKVRLHNAKQMLQTTNLNISEIAYDLGFTDPNYFSRTFSKEFGQPPSAVR